MSEEGTLHASQGLEESPDQPPYLLDVKHGRTPVTTAIQNFSPAWFLVAMDTGILGTVLDRLPYQFPGIQTLATICYVFLILQLVVFLSLQIVRVAMYPKAVWRTTSRNLEEITYWSCPVIAWCTLASLTATQVSDAYWGGHAFSIVAYVLWWMGAAAAFICALGIFITMVKLGHTHDRTMPPSIFLPIVALLTAASTGGVIVNYGHDVSARLAVPVIIFSYFLVGYGLSFGLLLYSMFMHRLISSGFPAPAKLPSLFILIGPLGQAATALQLLGTAANTQGDFGGYNKGTFLTASAASGLDSASTLLALLLLGFDYFWVIVALYALLEGALKKQLSYSIVYWSTLFPLATMTTAWEVLSVKMNSPTFKVLATAMAIILTINYFVNWGLTLFHVFKGTMISKSSTEEVEEMEKKQREQDEEKQD